MCVQCDRDGKRGSSAGEMRADGATRPGVIAAIGLIRLYRLTLSSVMGRTCRYLPTCSAFTETAIQRFGLWAGGWMGIARIASCNPWGGAGYDPVPDTLSSAYRWWRPWRGR